MAQLVVLPGTAERGQNAVNFAVFGIRQPQSPPRQKVWIQVKIDVLLPVFSGSTTPRRRAPFELHRTE